MNHTAVGITVAISIAAVAIAVHDGGHQSIRRGSIVCHRLVGTPKVHKRGISQKIAHPARVNV